MCNGVGIKVIGERLADHTQEEAGLAALAITVSYSPSHNGSTRMGQHGHIQLNCWNRLELPHCGFGLTLKQRGKCPFIPWRTLAAEIFKQDAGEPVLFLLHLSGGNLDLIGLPSSFSIYN